VQNFFSCIFDVIEFNRMGLFRKKRISDFDQTTDDVLQQYINLIIFVKPPGTEIKKGNWKNIRTYIMYTRGLNRTYIIIPLSFQFTWDRNRSNKFWSHCWGGGGNLRAVVVFYVLLCARKWVMCPVAVRTFSAVGA